MLVRYTYKNTFEVILHVLNCFQCRLIHNGRIKNILPEGKNQEPAINWARYQFAVTKRKEEERHSSSMFSMFDTLNQVVNFQDFINDDENIDNEVIKNWKRDLYSYI